LSMYDALCVALRDMGVAPLGALPLVPSAKVRKPLNKNSTHSNNITSSHQSCGPLAHGNVL
jgi:hypothetical protein